MGLHRKLVVLATSAALAVPAIVAGGAPASAAPAPAAKLEFANLTIQPAGGGWYHVYVTGHFNTNKAESEVGMRLKGDDPFVNDDLGISRSGKAYYGDFSLYQYVWGVNLNEDPEGEDEIYAWVSSSTGWEANTPNVTGRF